MIVQFQQIKNGLYWKGEVMVHNLDAIWHCHKFLIPPKNRKERLCDCRRTKQGIGALSLVGQGLLRQGSVNNNNKKGYANKTLAEVGRLQQIRFERRGCEARKYPKTFKNFKSKTNLQH